MTTNVLTSGLGLIDLAQMTDPKGDVMRVAEVLDRTNPLFRILPMTEANGTTYHKTLIRASKPAGTKRKIGQFISGSTSKVQDGTEFLMNLEALCYTDEQLLDLTRDKEMLLQNEAVAHISGLGETLADVFFYGDHTKDPEDFTGLSPRMATLDSKFIVGGGGTGSDLASIYVIMPGVDKVHFVMPPGDQVMGIRRIDEGMQMQYNSSGNSRPAYLQRFKAKLGLAVEDPRAIARYANIESAGSSNTFDEDNLITIMSYMPMGPKVILVNNTIMAQMKIRVKDKNNVNYAPNTDAALAGFSPLTFDGHPIVGFDYLIQTNTESAIA